MGDRVTSGEHVLPRAEDADRHSLTDRADYPKIPISFEKAWQII
jgi:hypothetical protein